MQGFKEDDRLAVVDWLKSEGIDPATVSMSHTMKYNPKPRKARLKYREFVPGADGETRRPDRHRQESMRRVRHVKATTPPPAAVGIIERVG